MNKPVLSVITVTYNALPLLKQTYLSVENQDYTAIEYIVVDGSSTDGTPDWLSSHRAGINKWVSESDKGIYDAMNKGLSLASGDFVLFLNSGDTFHNSNVVSDVMRLASPDTDVLYGEVMIVDENRNELGTRSLVTNQKLPDKLSWKSLRNGMVVSHQAFIVRRSIAPTYIMNCLAADIDWVITILKNSNNIVNTHIIIADFLRGGISSTQFFRAWRDRFSILGKHYGLIPNLFAHFKIIARALRNQNIKGTT